MQRLVDGAQGALVTAVSPRAFEQAFDMLRARGTMSLVGLPPGTNNSTGLTGLSPPTGPG
jgi:propanol-preferring alcohol dehydrogenase